MRIIKKDDLPLGGFDGIVETRLVQNPKIWPEMAENTEISHGFRSLIYLAMGHFKPSDGAKLHGHQEVDIVSVILNGKVGHEGSLGDGTVLSGPEVQVQRAGTGMNHAEFNAEDDKNAEFVQIWFVPPQKNLKPAYQNITIPDTMIVPVLGGQNGTMDNAMKCGVGTLPQGQTADLTKRFIILVTGGEGRVNDAPVSKGCLIEADQATITADTDLGLVVIQEN